MGFDVVEVLPSPDRVRITALLAANIVYVFLSRIGLRKRGAGETERH